MTRFPKTALLALAALALTPQVADAHCQVPCGIYDDGARIAKLKLVNAGENARVFRPDPAKSVVRFSQKKVS